MPSSQDKTLNGKLDVQETAKLYCKEGHILGTRKKAAKVLRLKLSYFLIWEPSPSIASSVIIQGLCFDLAGSLPGQRQNGVIYRCHLHG